MGTSLPPERVWEMKRAGRCPEAPTGPVSRDDRLGCPIGRAAGGVAVPLADVGEVSVVGELRVLRDFPRQDGVALVLLTQLALLLASDPAKAVDLPLLALD